METTEIDHPDRGNARRFARFVGHYLGMSAAMLIGMVVLAPLWPSAWLVRPDVDAVVMATNMTIGMVLWMRIRGHGWLPTLEMATVMYLPFIALLAPYRLGALSGADLMMAGHVLMFPLMLAAMVWRRGEYWH